MTHLNLSDYKLLDINYKPMYLDYERYNKLNYNYLLDYKYPSYKYNSGLSDYLKYQIDGSDLKRLLNIIGSDYIVSTNYNVNSNLTKSNNDNNTCLNLKTFCEKSTQTDDLDNSYESNELNKLEITNNDNHNNNNHNDNDKNIKFVQDVSIENNNNNLDRLAYKVNLNPSEILEKFKELEHKCNQMSKQLYELDVLCDFTSEEESRIKQEYLETKDLLEFIL